MLLKDLSIDGSTLATKVNVSGNNKVSVFLVYEGSKVTLKSLNITNGKSDWSGGGIDNEGTLTLMNSTLTNNSATYGGGIYNSSDTLTIIDTIFSNNSAGSGTGIYNYNSSPNLLNVTFNNNTGGPGSRGGAMVNYFNSSPHLTNVTFTNNSVALLGGGMLNSYGSNPRLVNVTFVGNSASDRGGAIYNWQSNPKLKNITFSGNSANLGGAVYNDDNSNPSIVNSILYEDTGGEVYNYSGAAVVTYSIVQGGYSGTGNLDVDPLLELLKDNGGFTQTMALLPNSPAIDAGDDANCPSTNQRGWPAHNAFIVILVHMNIMYLLFWLCRRRPLLARTCHCWS